MNMVARAAECNVSEVRTQLLKKNYFEFIEEREKVGHYNIEYTYDGFVLEFKNPDLEFDSVYYSITDDCVICYKGLNFEVYDWDWREKI